MEQLHFRQLDFLIRPPENIAKLLSRSSMHPTKLLYKPPNRRSTSQGHTGVAHHYYDPDLQEGFDTLGQVLVKHHDQSHMYNNERQYTYTCPSCGCGCYHWKA
ncbi:hypothetical protein HAX54_036190 [Datura stramonium]|uniref:Uncharacterized protein n=1 Tax=Datura stramonium TaxID=4076 RepID=A0ABS8SFW5_DATST|nr:hypothetical protein [Datura stramonium]